MMVQAVIEKGRVIKTDGVTATVMIDKGASCKGCGKGQMGMCNPGGSGMVMEVYNTLSAEVNDIVTIGIGQGIQNRGYLLLYGLPTFNFMLGSLIGYVLKYTYNISYLDVLTGFIFLIATLLFSFRWLSKMEKTQKLFIKTVERSASRHN
ncbi:MAG: SoxR reducing system RseC family protein [Candidatus Magnetominusculus sp. LBB02]|nr:SoxR reducing system RseC family protein [Candidatus Magnetominusculus sp. LBB02]